MTAVTLWLLIGLPGSGKSTWAERFAIAQPPLLLVSTDQLRADFYGDEAIQGDWLQIWRAVEAQFRRGVWETKRGHLNGIVYDATNARRRYRREVIRAARGSGITRILAVWVDTPIAMCLARNQQRSRQVPIEVIHAMARQLAGAPPHLDEGFDAVFHLWTP